jgi:ferrous iron transport protein A
MNNKNITLSNLNIGDKVKVIGYDRIHPNYRKKLLVMGLTPGVEFTITRIAPLGDPIEISVRGFSLVLRKNEANILKLERVSS